MRNLKSTTPVTHLCIHTERDRALEFLRQLGTEDSELRKRLEGQGKDYAVRRSSVQKVLAEWGIFLPLSDIPKAIRLPDPSDPGLQEAIEHFSRNSNPFGYWVHTIFFPLNR